MSEQALDLQAALSMLGRRRRVIVAAGLLGAVVGVLFVLARPPLYASSTKVLLPPLQSTTGATRDMLTQTGIVTSDAVLDKARAQVRPGLTRNEIAQLVTADSPSTDMLHIVARGSTAEGAESLAEAVAQAELDYQAERSSSLSNTEQAALKNRQSQLEQQLSSVNQEIARTEKRLSAEPLDSARAQADQTARSQLVAQESKLTLDINDIESQRSAQASNSPEAQIIQHAAPATRPRLLVSMLVSALIFTVAGVGLAALVVITLARRDQRLRTRDEIADALGSPVIGSVKSHYVRTTAAWSQLLEGYRPAPVDAWALRQVLDHIGAGPLLAVAAGRGAQSKVSRLSLVVVVVAGDAGALAVAGQLASHTASLGVPTHLTARQRHAAADALWATSARGEDLRPGLRVDPRRQSVSRRTGRADLVLELAVVERQQPVLPDLRRADAVLLIVSSGTTTEEDLARVAVAAYESGGRFRGIVVADPDSFDHTTGRLLQAQRAAEPPMPMKLTGVEPDDWREQEGGRP